MKFARLPGIFLCVLLLVCGVASAADPSLKIGFVDVDRILRDSAPAQRATKRLEKEFEGRRADVQKIADQGKSLQLVLDKGGLTDADRKDKERQLVKLNLDYQRMSRELNEDLNSRRNEELAGIQERVNNAVQQIAQVEKFDLILQEAAFHSPRIDITDKVLKALADK